MKQLFLSGFISLCTLLTNVKAYTQTVDDPTTGYNGVWAYSGGNLPALLSVNPNIRGALAKIRWADIQPGAGTYNWNNFIDPIKAITDNNLSVGILIWVGPDAPAWIYQSPYNVPKVVTDDVGTFPYFPYYLNATYKSLYNKIMDSVAAHIDLLPAAVRNKIIFYQSCEGKTGDTGPYDGNPPAQYAITGTQWSDFKHAAWNRLNTLYGSKTPKIHLLLNQGNDLSEDPWINANLPLSWRKTANQGDAYQLNNEVNAYNTLYTNLNTPQGSCAVNVRSRSEMDAFNSPYYAQAPRWNFYWHALFELHFGLDTWQIVNTELATSTYFPGYNFYAKYAGQKDPACSPGAFCALRDGLDASDFVRFPAAGAGTIDNYGVRALNIAAQFAAYGAKQEDTLHSNGGPMVQKKATGMNDVGWNIIAGNYERYLAQINANNTSIGYWRLGSASQEYGRFARGFQHSSSFTKDTLSFNVHDAFALNNTSTDYNLRIVYYDTGYGRWQVMYDAVNNTKKVAATIENGDTHTWLEVNIPLNDAYFGNRGTNGSDIKLANKRGKDNVWYNPIFHLLELTKVSAGARPAGAVAAVQPERAVAERLVVYPNPSNGSFRLSLGVSERSMRSVRIYNAVGSLVYSTNAAGKQVLIDSRQVGLKAGTYIAVVLTDEGKTYRQMLVVE